MLVSGTSTRMQAGSRRVLQWPAVSLPAHRLVRRACSAARPYPEIGNAALTGAGYGALYGAGEGEDTNRIWNALEGLAGAARSERPLHPLRAALAMPSTILLTAALRFPRPFNSSSAAL